MALKDRLNQLFNTQNLKQKQFADILQIGQSTLNYYLNGLSEPNFKNIMLLLAAFPNLNANWLLKGEGEMFLNDDLSKNRMFDSLNQSNEFSESSPPQYQKPLLIEKTELEEKRWELAMIEIEALRRRVELLEKESKRKK
jgi:transcriptional regulator with XRE-family HTH domain